MTDILTDIQKMQEAYAVMHNIPVVRQYSDRELEGYQYELSVAKTDIEEMMNAENDQQSRQHEDRA